MLIDLYLMQTYFEEQFGAVYEKDLVERYGRQNVSAAIAGGLLEHRQVPCGAGRARGVCRLSAEGMRQARVLACG